MEAAGARSVPENPGPDCRRRKHPNRFNRADRQFGWAANHAPRFVVQRGSVAISCRRHRRNLMWSKPTTPPCSSMAVTLTTSASRALPPCFARKIARSWEELKEHFLYQHNLYRQWYRSAGDSTAPDVTDADQLSRDNYFVGTPDECEKEIREHQRNLSAEEFIFWACPPGFPVEKSTPSIAVREASNSAFSLTMARSALLLIACLHVSELIKRARKVRRRPDLRRRTS
jgi:hypothetical protein